MKETEPSPSFLQELRVELQHKTPSERFEHIVLLILSLMLSFIILVALIRLVENVYLLVIQQYLDTTDFKAFQTIFGMLLTLLIAFEFRNSINAAIAQKCLRIQVELVLLIAMMALSRKFVVLDTHDIEADKMFALAAIMISLGVAYWLIKNRKHIPPH